MDEQTTASFTRAIIDWVVANGSTMGTFGPNGVLNSGADRAMLSICGIDYEASELGDLGGQEWSEDTFDESASHPGLWVDVAFASWPGPSERIDRWFVAGENLKLSGVIIQVIAAGATGDQVWKSMVSAEDAEKAQASLDYTAAYWKRQGVR